MNNDNFDDFDPFKFKCNYCYKTIVFTEQKIEKIKQKTPWTDDEYFILCEFCKKWHMETPTFIMTSGVFDNY